MCFGKKEKPKTSVEPQEKSAPPPPRQPRATDQRLASRRQPRSDHPVDQEQNHTDSQPREDRRVRNLDRTDKRRASKRLSGLNHPEAPQGATPDSDREIIIAVMGVTGKIQILFKPWNDRLR